MDYFVSKLFFFCFWKSKFYNLVCVVRDNIAPKAGTPTNACTICKLCDKRSEIKSATTVRLSGGLLELPVIVCVTVNTCEIKCFNCGWINWQLFFSVFLLIVCFWSQWNFFSFFLLSNMNNRKILSILCIFNQIIKMCLW